MKWTYYVEGDCEKAFLKSFMYSKKKNFKPGKVNVLNFNNVRIGKSFAFAIRRDTNIVIVIDTDKNDTSILDYNIDILLKHSCLNLNSIFIVMSIKNFEDEIVYSCVKLSDIKKMFSTNSVSEFKKEFIRCENLENKLYTFGFDIRKMWSRTPSHPFDKYTNAGSKIKE